MAARRKTFRKNFRRRGNLARKRLNWHQFNIDPCEALEIPFCEATDGCCTDQAKLVLLSNEELQDLYSDRATVVRLLGDLWIQPLPGTVATVEQLSDWILWMQAYQSFVGLRKGEVSSQTDTATFDIWDSTIPDRDDLSEGRWLKTWQHLSTQGFEQSLGQNLASGWTATMPVADIDVHTTAGTPGVEACSPMASGTGNICIETTGDVDCVDCGQALTLGQIAFSSATVRQPQSWHIHFDVKKKIPMRENEELYLMMNWRHFAPTPATLVGLIDTGFWAVRGNIRILTSMG